MERRMTADFPDRLRDARATIEAAKAREEHWKTEIREAVKAKRAPPLSPSPAPEEPLAPRLMLSDVTIERIAMLLARAAPKGVLMTRDELAGWFLGMNAYNEGARAFWIEAYGGRPYRLDRVKHSEPINIARLAVGWHGGIQPPRLAEVMREADDGLLARFVWFWPNPVPFDIADCAPDVDWVVRAFDRLRMLDLAPGENGAPSRPIIVPLDAAALQQLAKFGRLLQKERDGSGGLLHSAVGKARGLALRLSLVIAYLCWCAEEGYGAPPEVITEDIFLAAAKLVAEYVLPMAERTFGDAACPAVDRNAATLAHWIARERPTRGARAPSSTRSTAAGADDSGGYSCGMQGSRRGRLAQRAAQWNVPTSQPGHLPGVAWARRRAGGAEMRDRWGALFHALTGDTVDTVDTVAARTAPAAQSQDCPKCPLSKLEKGGRRRTPDPLCRTGA